MRMMMRRTPTTTPMTIPAIAPPLRPAPESESCGAFVSVGVEVDDGDGEELVVAHVYEPWKTSSSPSLLFSLSVLEHPAEPVATMSDSPLTLSRLSKDRLQASTLSITMPR